jgi:hypothetical protein
VWDGVQGRLAKTIKSALRSDDALAGECLSSIFASATDGLGINVLNGEKV